MRTVWSRRALQHLVEIRSYIAQDHARAGRQVAARLLESVEYWSDQWMNSGYWATEPGLGSHTGIFRLPRTDAFAPVGRFGFAPSLLVV